MLSPRLVAFLGILMVARGAAADWRPAGRPMLVVIDPGHGGANTGAAGAVANFYEKRLTLALARGVAERLRARGHTVVLTRDRDEALTLRQRVQRANELGADVFVSIHANASPGRSQRGFETYVLTPHAVDVDARALRTGDGPPRLGVDPRVARILDDVERGAVMPDAAALAGAIQRALAAVRGSEHDRGVRQESQHVLLGAAMPAVLVEVGFIDHPQEGRELADVSVQASLCDALAGAIAGEP